jgi:hypothetical protein
MPSNAPTPPAPVTWASEEVIRASDLRATLTNAIAFLNRPPAFVASQNQTNQSISNNSNTLITWDTESYDNYSGHLLSSNTATYYAIVAGWYLVEVAAFLSYTGGAGSMSAGVSGISGGTFSVYMGQKIPNTSGSISGVSCAKLVQMLNVGTVGGGSNDTISSEIYQNAGASEILLNGMNRFPNITATWVCASSGVAFLTVPANTAWPVPPSYITTAFMLANVTNAVNFLAYPPTYEAFYNSTGQNLASQASVPATGTTITLNNVTIDNYGGGVSGTYTIPAGCGGIYYAYGQVALAGNTTSVGMSAGLTVNSSSYGGSLITLWGGGQAMYTGSSVFSCANVRRHLRLNAGDTVSLAGFQHDSSGSSCSVLGVLSGSWSSRLILVWRAA